jgi:tRNA G10  N-methylase Trm11
MSSHSSANTVYAFTLGREWKLSLAELIAIFGMESYREHTELLAIFEIRGWSDEQVVQRFLMIGGSIRVMKIISETDMKRFPTDVIAHIRERQSHLDEKDIEKKESRKITFALGSYGVDFPVSNIGLRIKKTLQEHGLSARLVNTENKNIVSAVFKRERLGRSETEYNMIVLSSAQDRENEKPIDQDVRVFLATTLACQDIDAYTRRDTGKSRDMVVGMMPPKLVQMMINLAILNHENTLPKQQIFLYDPFCGLGTTLIEAANMGITHIYGSDLSQDMVTASRTSLDAFIKEEKVWQERIRTA